MKIVDYDDFDPLGVLKLNLLSLGYALTPERVALIRQLDARSFPCFAVYAVEDGVVAGQVGETISKWGQHCEQPTASTEQHRDLVDLQLVQHTGLQCPLRRVRAQQHRCGPGRRPLPAPSLSIPSVTYVTNGFFAAYGPGGR